MTAPPSLTVESLERLHPEWSTWLRLVSIARRAAEDPVWQAAVPSVPPGEGTTCALVTGAEFAVDARAVTRLVGALLEAVAGAALPAEPAVRTLEAAIAQDDDSLRATARTAGVDAALLGAAAPLVALPLLQACRRAWTSRIAPTWRTGACPVCGAWAAIAEARGVERVLRLRCSRCGADWATEPVRCPFCGEQDHEKLRALVGDGQGDLRRVEVCDTCRGYMKTVTTLTACAPLDVALLDVSTVDLDVAAVEHGYARPARPLDAPRPRVVIQPARTLRGLFSRA